VLNRIRSCFDPIDLNDSGGLPPEVLATFWLFVDQANVGQGKNYAGNGNASGPEGSWRGRGLNFQMQVIEILALHGSPNKIERVLLGSQSSSEAEGLRRFAVSLLSQLKRYKAAQYLIQNSSETSREDLHTQVVPYAIRNDDVSVARKHYEELASPSGSFESWRFQILDQHDQHRRNIKELESIGISAVPGRGEKSVICGISIC